MIFDAILGFICAIPNSLLNSLTSISSLTIPQGTFDWWSNVFNTLTYVFPIWSLTPILYISFSIKFLQIFWSLGLRIKGFIPTLGT